MTTQTQTPAPLSGRVALIVGSIGGLAVLASPFIPSPWSFVVGLVGFIACALAGFSVKPPAVVEGRPVLQGGALAAAITAMEVIPKFWEMVPHGWPQSVALGVASLLAFLTGRVLPSPLKLAPQQPQLPEPQPLSTFLIDTKAKALDVLENGAKGPPES